MGEHIFIDAEHILVAGVWTVHFPQILTAIAALLVGIVVGITGMGGGALMTPILIFLGVGHASTVVTADLTAAAIYKTGGATMHWRGGSANIRLAIFLICGSVPMAFLGPRIVRWINPEVKIDAFLTSCIGFALLLAAMTYALRLYAELRRRAKGFRRSGKACTPRPIPTIVIGALGGLLVGITSVGSGSVIMVALLILYPGLPAVKLVGTDLVQAVPLVLAAAISNILMNGLDWSIVIPLIVGSVPGCIVGARIAPRVRASYIRRGIVIVLTMSGLALLDKAGWTVPGLTPGETHPKSIALVGLFMLFLVPFVWALLRRSVGLPMFGTPTVEQIEEPSFPPAGSRPSSALAGKE